MDKDRVMDRVMDRVPQVSWCLQYPFRYLQVHHQTTKEDPSERPTELHTYEMEMRGDREPP